MRLCSHCIQIRGERKKNKLIYRNVPHVKFLYPLPDQTKTYEDEEGKKIQPYLRIYT